MPYVHFAMIGRNLDRSRFIKQYKSYVPKNITIMGEMRHEEVLDAIAACKVLVMTSKREGLPTVLLEAMAMGKNVVAPSQDGCKEVVKSKDYGFLYEPESLDHLVEQTTRALSGHLGDRARERILAKFDWRVVMPKIDAVYDQVKSKE
jgi:glycosyltransferase involved in cell wall biosynthesis